MSIARYMRPKKRLKPTPDEFGYRVVRVVDPVHIPQSMIQLIMDYVKALAVHSNNAQECRINVVYRTDAVREGLCMGTARAMKRLAEKSMDYARWALAILCVRHGVDKNVAKIIEGYLCQGYPWITLHTVNPVRICAEVSRTRAQLQIDIKKFPSARRQVYHLYDHAVVEGDPRQTPDYVEANGVVYVTV